MIKLFNAEALEWLRNCRGKYDMIFFDPPDNLNLKYGDGVNDKIDDKTYYDWLEHLILKSMFIAPIVWVSYYHKHDLKVKAMVNWIIDTIKPSWEVRTFIWRFTFGQYRVTDCASGYRPILRLSRPGIKWNFDEIRIPSVRMELGDSRAAGPRVPDDVWEFPRIVGNDPERRAFCPTQHPEALLERIVKMSGSGKVLELFSGSGTMIRVCKRLGVDLDTVELSKEYVNKLKEEHPEIEVVK